MENKQGSGETARALIRQGATDEETLELVRFLHPGGRTTLKTIQSYRSRMRDDFEDVPVGRDAPGIDRARLRELIVGQNHEPSNARQPETPGSHVETAREHLRAWRTNRQVLEAVLAAHPDCGYKTLNVSDLRSRMRDDGEQIPTDDVARRWQEGRLRPIDPTPPSELADPS